MEGQWGAIALTQVRGGVRGGCGGCGDTAESGHSLKAEQTE